MVVVSELPLAPGSIAVDDARVVWITDRAGLFASPKAGAMPPYETIRTGSNGYQALASTREFTFVTASGGSTGHVGRLDQANTYVSMGPTLGGMPFAIASDGTSVIAFNSSDTTTGGLYYAATNAPATLAQIAPRSINARHVALNGTHAFAADHGTVEACSLPGCPGGWSKISTENYNVSGLAATATALYWSTLDSPLLFTCTLGAPATCGPKAAIAGSRLKDGAPRDLALSNGRLYVTFDRSLGSCVPDKCDSTWTDHPVGQLIRGKPAHDETAFYWVAYDELPPQDAGAVTTPAPGPVRTNIRIMKLAK